MTADDASYLRTELARVEGRIMPWGPYRGLVIADIPSRYLTDCLRWDQLSPGLRSAIESTLRRRAEHFWAACSARRAILARALGL